MEAELAACLPCLEPLEVARTLPGPHQAVPDSQLALVWALTTEPRKLIYVSYRLAARWDAAGIDWRDRALDNLVAATNTVWTQELREREELIAVLLAHDDSLGPSRLLFYDELAAALGEDYKIATPERSTAVAFRNRLTGAGKERVEQLIKNLYA